MRGFNNTKTYRKQLIFSFYKNQKFLLRLNVFIFDTHPRLNLFLTFPYFLIVILFSQFPEKDKKSNKKTFVNK